MFEYFIEKIAAYYWDWYPILIKWYLIVFALLFIKVLYDQQKEKYLSKIKPVGKEVNDS